MDTDENISPVGKDGRRASVVVGFAQRQKLTRFGNAMKGLLDPILLPIVDEHWGLASALLITIMLIFMVFMGAALQLVVPAGTTGTTLQRPYDLLKSLGPSWHVLYSVMLLIAVYVILCGGYTLLDVIRPAFLQRFMLQPRPAGDFGGENLGLLRTVRSQCKCFVWVIPIYVFIAINDGPHTYTLPWVEPCSRNCVVVLPDKAPSITEFLVHFFFGLALNDVTYWYYHWMCHRHRSLYKNIHQMHHEYKQPFSMVSAHLHPHEFIATFLFAVVPPVVCRAHPFTVWIMTMVGTSIGIEAHSGYTGSPFSFFMEKLTLGLYGGTEHHDIHHQTPWCNYEPYFGYLDWACGTGVVHGKLGETPVGDKQK